MSVPVSAPALEVPKGEVYPPEEAAEKIGVPGYRVLYKLLVQLGLIYRYSESKGYFPTVEALEHGYVLARKSDNRRPALTANGLKYVRDRMKAQALNA